MAECASQIALDIAVPANPTERLGSIDALRGLALFGVLAINLETEFRVSIFEQFLPGSPGGGVSRWVETALQVFVDMKAFALFSLLFGVGLAIQFERLGRTGRRAALLTRRLLVLLIFGLIHLFLIWNGDILTEYALAGLVALPFLFGPNRWMTVGCVAFLTFYVLQPVLPPIVIFPDQAWLAEHVKAAETVYATGGFREVLAFRIEEVAAFLPLHIYVFPRTLGLFLLGALSWRAGFFDWGRRFPDWLWVTSALFIGVGLWLTVKAAAIPIMPPAGTVSMTLGYATLVLAVETSETGRRWLRWAEPVGRMAFTNYIGSRWSSASCSTAMGLVSSGSWGRPRGWCSRSGFTALRFSLAGCG